MVYIYILCWGQWHHLRGKENIIQKIYALKILFLFWICAPQAVPLVEISVKTVSLILLHVLLYQTGLKGKTVWTLKGYSQLNMFLINLHAPPPHHFFYIFRQDSAIKIIWHKCDAWALYYIATLLDNHYIRDNAESEKKRERYLYRSRMRSLRGLSCPMSSSYKVMWKFHDFVCPWAIGLYHHQIEGGFLEYTRTKTMQ